MKSLDSNVIQCYLNRNWDFLSLLACAYGKFYSLVYFRYKINLITKINIRTLSVIMFHVTPRLAVDLKNLRQKCN